MMVCRDSRTSRCMSGQRMDREGLNGCHFFLLWWFFFQEFRYSIYKVRHHLFYPVLWISVYISKTMILYYDIKKRMFRLIIVVLVEITMRQDKITNVSFGKFC